MGQDPEELKDDIASTRADMSNTLEAIGDRVSPGRIVQRKKNKLVEGVHSVRERVMGSASATQDKLSETAGQAASAVSEAPEAILAKTQGAPMLVGALAFGVGFLAAVAFPATAKEQQLSTQVLDAVEPAKEQLVDSAQEIAEHLKEPAKQAVADLKDAATDSAATLADTAKDAADHTKAQAADAVETVKTADTAEAQHLP
jgi:gas vesicle protein